MDELLKVKYDLLMKNFITLLDQFLTASAELDRLKQEKEDVLAVNSELSE